MGCDDLFKKQREGRKERKFEYEKPKANSYLIVTEGKRTEPLYFSGMVAHILKKMGGNINVYELPQFDINGEGCSTNKLIEKTDELVSKSKIFYEHIWVVFDKDDFQDFNESILNAERKGYKVAWSNQSFEYWIYLHFHYSDSALHRDDWYDKLSEIFSNRNLGDGSYRKNYEDIFNIINQSNGLASAIRHAKRRMSDYKTQKPSEYDPGTMVYKLAEELKKYLDEK